MLVSPMAEQWRAHGAALANYRGSLTLASVPPSAAAAHLRLSDACWRAALEVNGPEARKWLNGMVSANVRDLAPGASAPSFQLDPKGHILATLDVVCTAPDTFLLLTDQDQCAGLLERLRRFVFISKLTVADRSEELGALRLRGAAAEAMGHGLQARSGVAAVVASAPAGVPRLEIVAAAAALPEIWRSLAAQAALEGAEQIERDRIRDGEPRFGLDITPAELPQETGATDCLSFTKGCYVGQEIVERIRARGAVHRHLRRLAFAGPVAPGAPLTSDGKEVGRVTSVAAADPDGSALGYVRDPHAAAGSRLRAGDIEGAVRA